MYTLIATADGVVEPFKRLAQGADISWQNSEDEMKTVTHCAVIFDKLSCLEMLIQNGSDIFCKETRDWSPMVSRKKKNVCDSYLHLIALCRILPPSCLCCGVTQTWFLWSKTT